MPTMTGTGVLHPVTGSQMIVREHTGAGVFYVCAMGGHTSVDCPRFKSGAPPIKSERMDKWYWSTTNLRNLPRLYKIRKEPTLDSKATMHQKAGTCIWHCDTKKKPPRKRYKKVARDYSIVNWQGIRRNDMKSVNQAFGANKVEIKHKSLEAIRLLRQADCVLEEIHKCINDCTAYM